jgi:hypothetical protein
MDTTTKPPMDHITTQCKNHNKEKGWKHTSATVDYRQNGVHESIDNERTNGQSNVNEELMPTLWLIALCTVLVQVGNDEESYYLMKGGDNPNNELTRKK